MALLDVVLGYDCNLACDYCTITPAMRQRSLSSAQVLQALIEGRRDDYDTVSFTGGEPTIRRDLVGLVRAAQAHGYRDIKVCSNGLLYAHGANVDALTRAGVNRFHVSIHTHRADLYDALVRRADSYPLMVRGLDNLVERGLQPAADVIMKRDTFADLPEAVAWLHGRGVRTAYLWFVSLTDGNRDNVDSMPRMTEVLPAMRQVFTFARAHAMEVRSLHVPRCLLGSDVAHALDPGADRVRVVTPEATFELRQSRLGGQRHVPACESCAHRPICPGVRDDYVERYGDAEFVAV